MKAFIYTEYRSPDVLQLKDIEKTRPADDQVLIKIHAVSINGSDREGLPGQPLYARMLVAPPNRKDLIAITELCETGKIVPAMDREYSFHQIPEALRYVSEGRAKGKVVINMEAV